MLKRTIPVVLVLLTMPLFGAQLNNFRMEVLVNGLPSPEYYARGTTYIEAFKGREYDIRLTNPYGVRVAVALSVDGLNSIDARHTDARAARKWVLEPYETITIRGWQTSDRQARRFFFTSEEKSYGAWLGKTENLGIVSAAFFRERGAMESRIFMEAPREKLPEAPEAQARARKDFDGARMQSEPSKNDEYAATGIGNAISHPVTRIQMDLEDSPAAVISLRYEYRPALVALGVFAKPQQQPLDRREHARGFDYCPTPR